MRRLLGQVLIHATLISLGVLTALLLIEIALRIYNPLPFTAQFEKVKLPVNRTYRFSYRGKESMLKINSLGFRGPEPPQQFSSAFSIITLGGSTTECRSLDEGRTWPDLLSAQLQDRYRNIWLNNAGLSGHSTYGHYQLFREYLSKLRPNLILMLVGINDLGRHDLNASFDSNFGGSVGGIFKRSHLVQTVFNLYRLYRVIELDPLRTEFNLQAMQKIEPQSEKARKKTHQTHRDKYVLPYQQRLRMLVKEVKSHDIDVVLLTQPLLYGDLQDPSTGIFLGDLKIEGKGYDATNLWSFDAPLSSGEYWRVLELYNDATREVGRETDTLVIDIAATLPKDSHNFYDSMHFTEAGARKMADLIFGELALYLDKSGFTQME